MVGNVDDSHYVLYEGQKIEIRQTPEFRSWLNDLRDRQARVRIDDRLKRLASGNSGDTKSVGDGVQELRMPFGPGYRVYYMWRGDVLILLLTGGDKDSQTRDIARAKRMAKEADDGIEDTTV
jgi:putative addiction module killer protein